MSNAGINRLVRSLCQVSVVAAIVTLLVAFNVVEDKEQIAALQGLGTVLVVAVQNALEDRGVIPDTRRG